MNASALRHLRAADDAPAPLFHRTRDTRCTPPPGWATAYRLKHGGPSGLIPRSKRQPSPSTP
jgi:hypothetical protein